MNTTSEDRELKSDAGYMHKRSILFSEQFRNYKYIAFSESAIESLSTVVICGCFASEWN